MSIVFLLIPLGLVLVTAAAAALIWAVDSGQYDGDVEQNGRIAIEPERLQEGTDGSGGSG
jgi:cbb3-type cytochrome oxidase maturation protein